MVVLRAGFAQNVRRQMDDQFNNDFEKHYRHRISLHSARTEALRIAIALPLLFIGSCSAFGQSLPLQPGHLPSRKQVAPATPSEEKNLAFVLDWWREVIEARHTELGANYAAEDFIQHNPNIPTGRAALMSLFKSLGPAIDPIPDRLQNPPVVAGAKGNVVWLVFEHKFKNPKDPSQSATSAKVAVVNQSLARTRFPFDNPVGRRFRLEGSTDWIKVVGICAGTRYQNLREHNPPQFFLPFVQQTEVGGMTYVIRTNVAQRAVAPTLRRAVAQIDSDLPLEDVRTEHQQIDESMRVERALAALVLGFGLLALALAAVGIYGVMAYSVANRRNEMGIRLALGARPVQVRGMILRESAFLAIAGTVGGVGAALLLTRMGIPAQRATGVQPMEALRYE
jgi:predicted SnoaL-like aldol condensation-catalyzing enzyme